MFKIDGGITRAKLASNFVYVLDCLTEVYVWCGKETDSGKKEEAVRSAKRLFLKVERPPWSILRKINEGAEPVLFIEKFTKWEISKKKIGKAAALAANDSGTNPFSFFFFMRLFSFLFTFLSFVCLFFYLFSFSLSFLSFVCLFLFLTFLFCLFLFFYLPSLTMYEQEDCLFNDPLKRIHLCESRLSPKKRF